MKFWLCNKHYLHVICTHCVYMYVKMPSVSSTRELRNVTNFENFSEYLILIYLNIKISDIRSQIPTFKKNNYILHSYHFTQCFQE